MILSKKLLFSVLALVLLAAIASSSIVSGCAPSAPQETPTPAQQTFQLKFQSMSPPGDWETDYAVPRRIEMIEEETNGQLTFEHFFVGDICEREDTLTAVEEGLIDIALLSSCSAMAIDPVFGFACGLPGANRNPFGDAMALNNESELSEMYREILLSHNIYYLGWHSWGPYPVLMSNVAVRTLEEWEGVKVRTSGYSAAVLDNLGAATCYFPGAEMYEAMMLGTVDVVTWSADGVRDMNLYEVMDYLLMPPFMDHGGGQLIINLDVWNSLPENCQEAIMRAQRVVSFEQNEYYWGEMSYVSTQAAGDELGYEVIWLPDEEVDELYTMIADVVWDDYGAKSPECARVIEYLKAWYGVE